MPQVSMMGWVGRVKTFVGWVGLGSESLGWVGLGFEKVTHDQLWCRQAKAVRGGKKQRFWDGSRVLGHQPRFQGHDIFRH